MEIIVIKGKEIRVVTHTCRYKYAIVNFKITVRILINCPLKKYYVIEAGLVFEVLYISWCSRHKFNCDWI